MNLLKFNFVMIFSLIAAVLFAVPLQDSSEFLSGIDSSILEILESNEHVFRYDEEKKGPVFLPDSKKLEEVLALHKVLVPEVMVEALYKIPYPAGVDPESKDILDNLYELSHQVSSISGVKYYSERRKKYAVLFTDVYALNNLEAKKKIDDPIPGSFSYRDTLYIHMKENALGRGYYRVDYQKNSDSFSLTMSNESELGFLITVVGPENMIINLDIIPCSDSILIYGYCGVVLENDDFVNLLLDPYFAFYRRMTAMETWLYNSLHGTDKLPPICEPLE